MPDYRHAAEPDLPRAIDARALSASTRNRLALAVAQATLADTGDREPGRTRAWAKLATAGATLLALSAYVGFGTLPALPGSGPPLTTALWAAGLWALLAGGTMLLRKLASRLRSPVPPGVYLLPGELLDARDRRLLVVPMSLLRAARHDPAAGTITLGFARAGSYTFPIDPAGARTFSARLDEARARLDRAVADGSTDELDLADPLRADRSLVDAAPLADAPSPPRRRRAQLASLALISVILAPPLEHARDLESQRVAIAGAAARGDAARLLRYAGRGGALADEADRAALDRALADGSTFALRQYFELGGRRRDEADDALFAAAEATERVEPLAEYLWPGQRHTYEVWRLIFARDARYSPRRPDHGEMLRALAEREPCARDAALDELRERQTAAIERVSSRNGQGPLAAAAVLEAARDRGQSLWLSLDDRLPPGFGQHPPGQRVEARYEDKHPFGLRPLSMAIGERVSSAMKHRGPFTGALVPLRNALGQAPSEPTLTITLRPLSPPAPSSPPPDCPQLASVNLSLSAELTTPAGPSALVTVRADQQTWQRSGCCDAWVARDEAIELLTAALVAELEGPPEALTPARTPRTGSSARPPSDRPGAGQ